MGYQSEEIRSRTHTNHGVSDGLRFSPALSLSLSLTISNPGVSVSQCVSGFGFSNNHKSCEQLIKDTGMMC